MRRTHAGFTGLLLAGALALAGCGAPAGQSSAFPSPSITPSVTVLRASAADREGAAAAMQAVTDFYGGAAWDAAKALAGKRSMDERNQGGGYAQLVDMTGTARMDQATPTIAPLLSGKTLGDFDAWQDWQGRVIHLASLLQQWGSGDVSAEADASAALSAARADIGKIRK